MTFAGPVPLVSPFYLILVKSDKYDKVEEEYLELKSTKRLNRFDVKLMSNAIIFNEITDYGYFCVE